MPPKPAVKKTTTPAKPAAKGAGTKTTATKTGASKGATGGASKTPAKKEEKKEGKCDFNHVMIKSLLEVSNLIRHKPTNSTTHNEQARETRNFGLRKKEESYTVESEKNKFKSTELICVSVFLFDYVYNLFAHDDTHLNVVICARF